MQKLLGRLHPSFINGMLFVVAWVTYLCGWVLAWVAWVCARVGGVLTWVTWLAC